MEYFGNSTKGLPCAISSGTEIDEGIEGRTAACVAVRVTVILPGTWLPPGIRLVHKPLQFPFLSVFSPKLDVCGQAGGACDFDNGKAEVGR